MVIMRFTTFLSSLCGWSPAACEKEAAAAAPAPTIAVGVPKDSIAEPPRSATDLVIPSLSLMQKITNHYNRDRILKLAEQVKYNLSTTTDIDYTRWSRDHRSTNRYTLIKKYTPLTKDEMNAIETKIEHIHTHWVSGCMSMLPLLTKIYFKTDEESIMYHIEDREFHMDSYETKNYNCDTTSDIWKVLIRSEEVIAQNLCDLYYKTHVTAALGDILLGQRVVKMDEIKKLPYKDYYEYTVWKRNKHLGENNNWTRLSDLDPQYTYVWCDIKWMYTPAWLYYGY